MWFMVMGTVGLMVMLLVLAHLSRHFGAVAKRPPHYRFFYLAIIVVLIGLGFRILLDDGQGIVHAGDALVYDMCLFIGILIAVLTAWRYWGWLLYEREP
jgi:hypothetical protein